MLKKARFESGIIERDLKKKKEESKIDKYKLILTSKRSLSLSFVFWREKYAPNLN